MSDFGHISGHAGELILIVEDSPTQAEQLRYVLEKNRYRVAVATTGSAALAMISKLKPILIISDIIMPEMDGYELCRRIKALEEQRHIPVILLTSLSDPQGVIRGLACGADNFITKPYDEALLLSRITDMLENGRMEQDHSASPGLEISFACQKYLITSDRRQILDLLLSTYEAAIHKNNELITARDALHGINEQLEMRVAERTADLERMVHIQQIEIEERTVIEEELLSLNRLYSVLTETNQAIVRTNDQSTLFCDFCRIAVEEGGFKLAWVGLLNEESGEVKIVACEGATGYLDGIKITANEEPDELEPTGITVREGTSYVCNDFLGSPLTRPWHERGRLHDIRSMASIALKQEGQVVGALTLCADNTDYFGQQEVDLLRRMGADISFALDIIVRETRRREAEQSLMKETAERLMAVEALREKEQMLIHQSRLAAMGEMIGNIAHQWRQPLNTLGMIVQQAPLFYKLGQLNKEFVDGSAKKSMDLIRHMSQTIDDFRNFFKPDKEKVLFNLNEVLVKSLTLMEGSLGGQRINIKIDVREDADVYGYPNEFSQVLINILANARDALTEREVKNPQVTITLGREGKKAVVSIADNAGGIPGNILDRIFDPYFSTKGPQAGTGVGLFISKTIIEKNMGGRLVVHNTSDGAEFRIEV